MTGELVERHVAQVRHWFFKKLTKEQREGFLAVCGYPGGFSTEMQHKAIRLIAVALLDALRPTTPLAELQADDETYEIGKRDGYDLAVQEIDQLTGGDGEYRYCTDHDPERHTPDAATMKQRIADRFAELQAEVAEVRAERDALLQRPIDLAKMDSIDDDNGTPEKMVAYYWHQQATEARAEIERKDAALRECARTQGDPNG